MSALDRIKNRKQSHAPHGDFELNLAPIIDCFTVLITFLLAGSAWISVGFLEAGIAASGADVQTTEPPTVLELAIQEVQSDGTDGTSQPKQYKFTLSLQTGDSPKKPLRDFILATNDQTETDLQNAITESLKNQKEPQVGFVLPEAQTSYPIIVTTLSAAKKVVPMVSLGNF